jgi:D-glycero-alpha-D-manno-heptose 1-phosphate guanylyltransferase
VEQICIILAGGFGTRLRSVLDTVPKCLAPIHGVPFIEWQIKQLARQGISRFIVSLGVYADQVVDHLCKEWSVGYNIEWVNEVKPLGTGGAVRFCMSTKGIQETIVVNGDTYLNGSLEGIFEPLHVTSGELARIITVRVPNQGRYGGVEVDSHNTVVGFLEKGREGGGLISAGIYRIHSNVFCGIEEEAFSLERRVFENVSKMMYMTAHETFGDFIDIGTPEDYQLASIIIRTKI